MELADLTKYESKTESYLITPHILIQHLQPLHIVTTCWMKTLTQTLLMSYHHILILLYNPNTTVLQMTMWVQIIYNQLYFIKVPTIMVIHISKITIICSHMRHLKKIRSSYFGDTIPTTTTPQSSTLPPPEKEYICFQIEVECAYSSKCGKSRALIKVLKWIFDIDSFDKQFIFIKGLLQSKQPKNTWFPLGLTNH